MSSFRIVLITFALLCYLSNVLGRYAETEEQILKRIFSNYSSSIRPPSEGPTEVTVNLYLRSVEPIDVLNGEYTIQVTLRQEWKDERLKFYPSIAPRKGYLTQPNAKKLWLPDLFIRNEKTTQLHYIIMPNVFVRIYPDGNILHSIRISLTMPCGMKLQKFPFDSQNCTMQITSYGMTTDDILFKWRNVDPIQASPELNTTLVLFSLQKLETGTCYSKTVTGLYSCLRLDLLFKRHFPYYLIQIYIPCASLVILAWLSFWMDYRILLPRLYLTATTYLIMMIATGMLNYSLPKTSYTKAVDNWTGICLTFVTGTVFQTIILNFFGGHSSVEAQRVGVKTRNIPDKIDIISRVLYPALFALFTSIYFAIYLR